MTNEEKKLLLADLCARLPYGVIADCGPQIRVLDAEDYCFYSKCDNPVCKPYLRPMSSMTEEEKDEYDRLVICNVSWVVDAWLNKKMFDYRGLIPMGLALEAPEGMYKIE